jgi:hypothetical protein
MAWPSMENLQSPADIQICQFTESLVQVHASPVYSVNISQEPSK